MLNVIVLVVWGIAGIFTLASDEEISKGQYTLVWAALVLYAIKEVLF